MVDRIYKLVITGFVNQKDYMDEPDTRDFLDPLQWDTFVDVTDITFTELVETTEMMGSTDYE